ncbi:unnamed protein product [Vitrella brassicaformis CCMP3155]|uniref:Uncharacterized protein n=1 Tax=Vitrella brassicaformis (strain CCMP3155) TaxID=1169540 RepID=A0A0G4EWH9_VITBC|nr:unnamed protein product [Vitrella brassicaformis CCMP3155]|eukprot:CEM02706.1 unnamed protein product [Vitrella brassicaformis CCMP3155]
MTSKLCADAGVVREGLQRLQRDAQLSCEKCQRDGNAFADAFLTAASAHASVAESSSSAMVDAFTRAAASFPHQPPNDIGASATAPAAAAVEASPEQPPNADSSMVEERVLSFRLTSTSGKPPTNDGPARLRLSPDELAGVFGFYQPWELARVAPKIGKMVFDGAAKGYTHLTIDGSDKGGVRQLRERLPLELAYRWGQRATNHTHLHVIYPCWASSWCRGIWVAILEGNAAARKAMRERREEGQAEGGASAAAAASRQDSPSAASSIKVLSFEKDSDDGVLYHVGDVVSAEPLSPSPSPVNLSALEEVHAMPYDCAAVRTDDRVWHTPSVRVMTFKANSALDERRELKEWMTSCEHLETFDGGLRPYDKVDLLRVPPVGTSLARLRSIGTLNAGVLIDDELADLQEALVERGCRKSLSELPIVAEWGVPCKWVLCELARLSEAVLQPQALDKPQVVRVTGPENLMGLELIEWMADESSQVQKLVREFAAVAGVVVYKNELTDPNAAADTVYFPSATIFRCPPQHLSAEVVDGLARTVANSMPQCRTIELVDIGTHSDAAKNAVVFLSALKRHMSTREGQGGGEGGGSSSSEGEGERRLSVRILVSAGDILDHSRPLQEWASHDLPVIDEVHIDVEGDLPAGATEEAFNGSLMASLTGLSRAGVSKASAALWQHPMREFCIWGRLQFNMQMFNMQPGVRWLFNREPALAALITMRGNAITVARRT